MTPFWRRASRSQPADAVAKPAPAKPDPATPAEKSSAPPPAEPTPAAEFPPAADLAVVPRNGQDVNRVLVAYRHTPVTAALHTIGQKHSMLHLDVLTLLYHFARTCSGQVLEIGAYVGGSTIALARGARESGQPDRGVNTIEPGGSFPGHPVLPSEDILKDLRRNLEKREVSDRVEVFPGLSTDPAIVDRVHRKLAPRSVGLLVIDADGEIHAHLERYHDLLTDDCYVVLDDYYGPGEKSAPTSRQVEELVARGELVSYGLYGWGTWVGRRHHG